MNRFSVTQDLMDIRCINNWVATWLSYILKWLSLLGALMRVDTLSYAEGIISIITNAKLHLFKLAQSIHLLINANFMQLSILKRSGLRWCLNPAWEPTRPLSLPYLSPPISYNQVLLRFSSDKHRSKDHVNNTEWRIQGKNVNWNVTIE